MRFGKRREHAQEYAILADSQAAMTRCLTDNKAQYKKPRRPLSGGLRALRDGDIAAATVVPGHAEVEGNEVADRMAKEAAAGELYGDSESRWFQSRTSMAYLKRRATEAKTRGTKKLIAEGQRGASLTFRRKKTSFRKELKGEKKAVASRCCQLLTGNASIAPFHKEKLKKTGWDRCWWCKTGKRQSREGVREVED